MGAKQAGFDDEQCRQLRRGWVEFDDTLAKLLAVARESAKHAGFVDDATWQAALDAGYTRQQLLDCFADTVRTIMTNSFNHLVGTELDLPSAPGLEAQPA